MALKKTIEQKHLEPVRQRQQQEVQYQEISYIKPIQKIRNGCLMLLILIM